MMRHKRYCSVCNTAYSYCSMCTDDKLKPTWMSSFCSEPCKTVWDICTRFNMNLLDRKEAIAQLKKCDLSNKRNFVDFIKDDLARIYARPKKQPLQPNIEEAALGEETKDASLNFLPEKEQE